MGTTHELTMLAYSVLSALEQSEGVIDESIDAQLDSLEGEVPAKLDALRWVAKAADADAAHLKAEAKGLLARAKARENLARSIKDRAGALLLAFQEVTGEDRVKSTGHSYWLQVSHSVEGPEAVEEWPEAYRRQVVKVSPDKTAAKAALKAGEEIPGVVLVPTTSIRWK
jgi:hypothetical protein